jgi:hypothetical protein
MFTGNTMSPRNPDEDEADEDEEEEDRADEPPVVREPDEDFFVVGSELGYSARRSGCQG